MGNGFTCMKKEDVRVCRSSSSRSSRKNRHVSRSDRKLAAEDGLLQRRALSMTLYQHQISQRFDSSSMSRRFSSGRRPPLRPSLPAKQSSPEVVEDLKVKKFVLVHGEGFGAWCWYKTISLLEESGLIPIPLDLPGSHVNSVSTLADYSQPLIQYFEKLPEDEQVILVGHSSGGASISYAIEQFPEKVSKAVFLCATMLVDGQRPLDAFSQEIGCGEFLRNNSELLTYGNGKDNPPTGFMFDKEKMKLLYLNNSPPKDIALASVCVKQFPLGPITGRVRLSRERYGRVRCFYVQTLDDRVLPPALQEKLVRDSPPERVLKIKGSDHCPFFSKPQALHKTLLEIANIP